MTAADVSEWTPIETAPTLSALVGARLREVRRQRGLSAMDVARALGRGFGASIIAAQERGERVPNINQLDRLARLYRVQVWELLPERPIGIDSALRSQLLALHSNLLDALVAVDNQHHHLEVAS